MDYKKKYEEALERAKKYYNRELYAECNGSLVEDIFPELKESEDERIRKAIIEFFQLQEDNTTYSFIPKKDILAWLEKQCKTQVRTGIEWVNTIDDACDKRYSEEYSHGEYCHEQSFRWGFQEGVDWLEKQSKQKTVSKTKPIIEGLTTEFQKQISHLIASAMDKEHEYTKGYVEWVAQSLLGYAKNEQTSTNKVEPKFKIGDFIVSDYCMGKVIELTEDAYLLDSGQGIPFSCEHNAHLWTIQDAKDSDVLAYEDGWTCIFKTLVNDENFSSYCFMDKTKWFCEVGSECHTLKEEFVKNYGKFYPATKKQRDLLFSKMKEAGYEWDAEKKELKKIESAQSELPNCEDYGIDSLYHAARILEKTLGEVEGYQSDDGILEHKCAIKAVNRLYKQNLVWSEEDERYFNSALWHINNSTHNGLSGDGSCVCNWLKSLKERYAWKPSEEHYELEEFAKIVRGNLTGINKNVQTLFEAKYQQLTGNKMYRGYKD